MDEKVLTISSDGVPLTETLQGYTMPADYSFECVNDYVHDFGREFEELQYLCLGMANVIDGLRNQLQVEQKSLEVACDLLDM